MPDVQNDPTVLRDIAATGAKVQLTAMSVEGKNGERAERASRWILDNDLATVIASDCHSPTPWRPPTMRGAYHVVRRDYGESLARRLCIVNPHAIATSQDLPTQLRDCQRERLESRKPTFNTVPAATVTG